MSISVYIALFGIIPLAIVLFSFIQPRHAVIATFLIGWLFLPMAGLSITGLPDYTKVTATTIAATLGALAFDRRTLLRYRPHFLDIPMLVWCLCPFASSVSNGLGAYDGASSVFLRMIIWGIPYFLGRVYFPDLASLRELAIGLAVGGIIYIPFCLWEVRMAPTLHYSIYGFAQKRFVYLMRYGGYRPVVFMDGGLMLTMWMTITSVAAVWLWVSRSVKQIWGVPMSVVVPAMLITAALCKGTYAIMLLLLGLGVLFFTKWTRHPIVLVSLILIVPIYMIGRTTGVLSREPIVSLAQYAVSDEERIHSLDARLNQEELCSDRALQRPAFGWGGWKRAFPVDHEGQISIRGIDGLWTITIGENGLVGLISMTSALLLPVVMTMYRYPVRLWSSPQIAPAAVLATIILLFTLDSLLNAKIIPLYIVMIGAVITVTTSGTPILRHSTGTRKFRRTANALSTHRSSVPGSGR